MEQLQEIVTNYQAIQPFIAFVGSAFVGTVTRLAQNHIEKDKTKKANWLIYGAVGVGISAAYFSDSGVGMYAADIGAALIGDYLATRVVDKITSKK